MSVSLEITGKVHHIGETQQISDKYKKRECVLHVENPQNPQYDDFISIQFGQDNCSKLDSLKFQDEVKIQCNVKGRQYSDKNTGEIKYFNSIEGWKVEVISSAPQQQPVQYPTPTPTQTPTEEEAAASDDLPF